MPGNKESSMELGQEVIILAIETEGVIEQILHSIAGTQYSIAYWFNGERKSAWVRAAEIK